MKSIDKKLEGYMEKHWNIHKSRLLIFHAVRTHKAGMSGEQILPADGNSIIEQIAYRAFCEGFDCGVTKVFSDKTEEAS